VYLPRVPSPAETIAPPQSGDADPRGAESVLIIEEDDAVRGAVRAVLGELGYRVLDAPCGELGVRQAQVAVRPVDLVLADLRAPGINGREVVDKLRGLGQRPKLLWMSGDTDRVIAQHELRGEPLLRKAFSPSQLAWRLREVLDEDQGVSARPAKAGGE
jgi:DNA-binding response OmpR family regulator